MPARSITATIVCEDTDEEGPTPPVPPPGWARAYVLMPVGDAHGVSLDVDGQVSIRHLVLCVFSEQRRRWGRRAIDALEIAGDAAAGEIRLRAEITAQERIADGLRRFGLRDALTDLPNRELLLDRVSHATMRWTRTPERAFAVLSVGIDQLQDIGSTLGYEAADDVLAVVAERLRSAVRGVDTVARTGGEDFAILLESMTNQADAITVARRVRDAFRSPVVTRWSDEVMISASVGIALITSGVDSAPQLLQLAAVARRRAQTNGAGVQFFDAGIQERAQTRLRLQTELRQAVEAGQFELHYQPIISLETGRVTQLEALVRWRHPGGRLIAPGDFVPLAEETGVIVPIGWWVLAQACLQLSEWRRRFDEANEITVSVNVAARQLAQPDLVERVESVLSASGLGEGAVHLEVTENSLLDESANARATLKRLRRAGVGVALDDYGIGYSSLRMLHEMPLDAVKIDRSVVARLPGETRYVSMITTIQDLARQIGVAVVAEGIESAEQLDLVRTIGCERAQGYLISHPLPQAQVDTLLATAPVW
ncbi:MAG TPA: bifunctional diguanylate cyclase/phosphodiesterase [Gemmatimonadaceae bacterium]|nr:bifunctional diguanylate cyclase/phosphodiesterase [Gemmatimonadaceae bacterium]